MNFEGPLPPELAEDGFHFPRQFDDAKYNWRKLFVVACILFLFGWAITNSPHSRSPVPAHSTPGAAYAHQRY